MLNKLFISLLIPLTLCSCSLARADSSQQISKESYATGELVFDLALKERKVMPDEVVINADNNIVLKKEQENGVNFYALRNNPDLPRINYSLYLADINNDGSKEICYIHQLSGSTFKTRTIIYDVKNEKVLRDSEAQPLFEKYIFHSVENGVFIENHANPFWPSNDENNPYKHQNVIEKKVRFIKSDEEGIHEETELLDFNPINLSVELVQNEIPEFTNAVSGITDKTTNIETYKLDKNKPYYLLLSIYYEGVLETNKDFKENCFDFDPPISGYFKFETKDESSRWYIDYFYKVDTSIEVKDPITITLKNTTFKKSLIIEYN